MILKFPDLDTLKLALISGAVPPAVSQAPAVAGFDGEGQLWLEPSASLAKAAQAELRKLGVQVGKSSGADLVAEVCCWLEMLPLQREGDGTAALPEQTPVLFDLPGGQHLARMAVEMLRLGNDRQSYRWLEPTGQTSGGRKPPGDGESRALLRVIGPPYYSLLRALDHQGRDDAPRAFVERAPRVWVERGYVHPLVERVKPPKDQVLLLRPPRQWLFLPEAPFRDVYEVMEFDLPGGPVGWQDGEIGQRMKVTPRLARGGTEPAELWVLKADPVNELNRLVQNADDHLLGRLAFAVGEHGGKKTIVLRVRPSKLSPPALGLGEEFRPFSKMPNLFLPCGWRLHPPLRRDVVRKLLADDPDVLTWLYPGPGGAFTPETISHDAFRPLTDWIDYVIDHDSETLQTWVQSTTFDFESFVCEDDGPAKPKRPPSDRQRSPRPDRVTRGQVDRNDEGKRTGKRDRGAEQAEQPDEFAALAKVEPSELEVRLREMEERFLSLEGEPEELDKGRQELWPQLAAINAELNRTADAGLCWTHALWPEEGPPDSWRWHWFLTEARAVPHKPEKGKKGGHSWAAGGEREISGDDLDRVLSMSEPTLADVRALAPYLVWAARRNPPPGALVERLNAVQGFLEAHEGLLPVRAVWLAWVSFAQLTHGDVLALARARDRLLERLFTSGLRPEQDLPSFLRSAGQPTGRRFRGIGKWLTALGAQAHSWSKENTERQSAGTGPTHAYIDLIFAYGLARMGEADASRELMDRARKSLGDTDPTHSFLAKAFAYRIKQAMESRPLKGSLPAELFDQLKQQVKRLGENERRMPSYLVDRMRSHSRILEPHEKINPYRRFIAHINDLDRALAELAAMTDRREIVGRVGQLLGNVPQDEGGNLQRAKVLAGALEVAPRAGEAFTLEMLAQLLPTYDALSETGDKDVAAVVEQAELLEKALFVAAHFDRKDTIQALVARFRQLLHAQRDSDYFAEEVASLIGECFRGLRKLGMREEIDALLRQMAEVILKGRPVGEIDVVAMRTWPAAMRALLHVASGWLYFGQERQAEPILNAARTALFKEGGEEQSAISCQDQVKLACAYAAAAGQMHVEIAQRRLSELFQRLRGLHDGWLTNIHYNLLHLDVVEAVVLAVVNDDNVMGADARRWLDDDEFLVRRRIHREFQALKA